MMTGAAAQLVANPTDLVKVQMQMEGRRLLAGEQPRFQVQFSLCLHLCYVNKKKENHVIKTGICRNLKARIHMSFLS